MPINIAVDAAFVYWTNSARGVANAGTVMKVPIGGGTPITLACAQTQPWGIAVDATSVYWTNLSDGTVMKVSPK